MKERNATAQRAFDLLEKLVEDHGCELLDVEFLTSGKRKILRLTIDKTGGVGLDECSEVSLAAEPVLDDANLVDCAYDLEVSSPGADRPILTNRDFERNNGMLVEVFLKENVGRRNHYEGILNSFSDGEVEITLDEPFIKGVRPKTNGTVMRLDRGNIKLIRRALRF